MHREFMLNTLMPTGVVMLDAKKSTSGHPFLISGGVVNWKSKKQTCIALSMVEAEHVALTSAAQEATWMRQLTAIVCRKHTMRTISLPSAWWRPSISWSIKAYLYQVSFHRDQVNKGTLELKYCPTKEMVADKMTNGLSKELFAKLWSIAGVTILQGLYYGSKWGVLE